MAFETNDPNDDGVSAINLTDDVPDAPLSTYVWHQDGDDLAAAIIDRFTRFREWESANGLLRGWRIKLAYYHNEYRSNLEIPHLPTMQVFGSQGEYQFVSVNHLRSLLETVKASVIQNPPTFKCRAINSDAESMESASLYDGVLDYYTRDLKLGEKINKAVEFGLVTDQGFMLVEWDAFATNGDAPDSTIWQGAPVAKVLTPWDVCYDPTRDSWNDLDWIIVRDWVDREKVKAQFPEFANDAEAARSKAQVMASNTEYEGNTRYELSSMLDISNDIQVFKMYHRPQPWMPNGRFVMALETGKLIFESPAGLVYPKLPVERFVCNDQCGILLGYSPINELLGPQEAINTIISAITTNCQNYANQYVAVQIGTELNPKTLSDGQKIIEYPAGSQPPQGLNLTNIPEPIFVHVKDMMEYMQVVPGVSNASRGQAPGANSTGSAMAFLSAQTAANQGSMSDHYAQFSADVSTALLHVLRVFARTQKTINIMGQTVNSKTVVLADALKDFDEVVVDMGNPIMNTAQGRMQMAQMLMQWGDATAQEALQVAQSGNLGPAVDPAAEDQFYMQQENAWLLNGEQVMVNALDDHNAHIMAHKQLFNLAWLRKPDLAQKMGITNAPQVMQDIMTHIQQHMQMLGQNQTNSMQTHAPAQPGQPQTQPQAALGHIPHAAPPTGNPAQDMGQAQAMNAGTHMPTMPNMPMQPK